MSWEKTKIQNLCKLITSGGTPLTSRSDYYQNGTIPWMKTTEVHKDFIYQTDTFITELGLQNCAAKIVPANSIVVAMYGDGGTAGKCAIAKIPLSTNQACCNLVIDEKIADYLFVYYSLKINYINLVNLKLGGSQQNLNSEVIKNFEIKLPPLPIQQRIAEILGCYDELIENYQRQIKILESTAQEIYREMFVRRIDKENLPKVLLDDLVTTQYGFTASATEENTGVKFLRITDISDSRIDWDNVPYCEIPEKEQEKYELKFGDILVARIGATAGYAKFINKNHPKSVFASYLIRMQAKNPLHSLFLGMTVDSKKFRDFINQTAGGAAQPQANVPVLVAYELTLPTDEMIKDFNKTVSQIWDLIENFQSQISKLRQMRDKLLPRLLNGELVK